MNIDKNILASLRQQQKTKLSRLDDRSQPDDALDHLQDIIDVLKDQHEELKEWFRYSGYTYGRWEDDRNKSLDRAESEGETAILSILKAVDAIEKMIDTHPVKYRDY
jgi:hypothetical protein